MKIVVVICSLATFAIAVPVVQEHVIESSLNNQALSTKREKKSALPDTTRGLLPEYGIDKVLTHSSKKSGQGTSVETKSFRKPIIIKRKLGYHVYRDSDEEMAYAEPGENCREQVKFKLCDHEPVLSSKNGVQSRTFKCVNDYKTDNEMENSIKMARKAVEHLQKDLKRMENFSPKMAYQHIEDIESNSGLHHDIEIAREALEHIEQNFESGNSEANKVNELQIPKSQDVEKLTRWREAIENIHKNFEIVKNIEDALKTDKQFSLFRSDIQKAVKTEEPRNTEIQFDVHNKFKNDNLENNDEINNEDTILKSASNIDEIAQLTPKTENIDNIGKDVADDMFISPTENREKKVLLHSDSLKSEINYKDASIRSDAGEIESTIINKYANEILLPKSVPELQLDPMLSTTLNDIPNDKHVYQKAPSMRSSETHNEEIQLNEYQEEPKYASTRLDIENNFDDKQDKSFKFVPEMQPFATETLPSDKGVITNDQQSHREESSMRSSENQNEKMQSSENKEVHELLPMGLDIERHPEERTWQYSKSVPELAYDSMVSMPMEELVITDDQHDLKEKASMRSSESQNEKSQFDEYQEESKHKTTRLDIENNSDDTKSLIFKSVPEMQPFPIEAMPLDKGEVTNDQQSHRKEASMRSSESQNEKMQSNDNKELHEFLPMGLDTERIPEERSWIYSKSVPELAYDSMVSMPTEEVVITDDQHDHKEEASMRSSENQNEKLQLSEYKEEPKHVTTRLDIENNSDDTTSLTFKSVPEMQPFPIEAMPLDKGDIINDQQSHREEVSMRSSESQNEKKQSNENKELHEFLPMGLDTERIPEERSLQYSKSVPELAYDSMVSMPTEEVVITDDQHDHKEETSMRSSENQNEKLQLNEYQEEPKYKSTRLDIENNSDNTQDKSLKSVPEMQSFSTETLPLEKGVITNDQYSHREEASMRSSESQNEKVQSNENKELHEFWPMGLDIERIAEERSWQHSKSVPEQDYESLVSMPKEAVVITDDQHSLKEEGSLRSSESQNEKLKLNEYQEEPKYTSTRLDIENNSDNTQDKSFKSVPEMQSFSTETLPLEKGVITNDQHYHREEASMRSSESQNEKMQSNENKESHEFWPMGLDMERIAEERSWQHSKSVPVQDDQSMVSMPKDAVVITDDQHSLNEEGSLRSSESQNEKLQLNEYQEEPKYTSTRLDIENNSDNTQDKSFKSVPEMQSFSTETLPLVKGVIKNDQYSHREEASMRSSETQNEKVQSNENKELHEFWPMGLDIERIAEERSWQHSKSVPEQDYESMVSMPKEAVVITDDQHSLKEEGSLRSSESQNEKLKLNEYQEEPKYTSTRLDIENNSDNTQDKSFKSVPEMQSFSTETLPLEKGIITNDQHSHREEASVRSSENQNEQMSLNENKDLHEFLPMGLDIERIPEERSWLYSKSVPELTYDSMVSMPTKELVITDGQHAHKEETSMRSSESQNEKLQLNEYHEEPKHASPRLDSENNSDDTQDKSFKSVPEMQPFATETLPLDKGDITNDQQSQIEEASMRSSETQNEQMQLNENKDLHEFLPMGLEIERIPEERSWQYSKSVPELTYDSMVSMPTEELVITDGQHAHKEETSMRSSESHNEKLQLNKYQEEPKYALPRLDIENNSDDTQDKSFKSVPEMQPFATETLPLDKGDITNDQQSQREEASMRSSETQNEQMQLNENKDLHEFLPMGLEIERIPEERSWQYSKSVPELTYDSMVSMPTEELVITDGQHAHKEETSMRSSESHNEKLQLNKYQEEPKHASPRLDSENNSDDTQDKSFKSVPEMQPFATETLPLDKGDLTNDQQSHREEASMRSSKTQNEQMQLNENKDLHEFLPMGFEIVRIPEERSWQYLKSVPELTYDSMVSMPTEELVITDDQQAHKEETSMRSSESQNEELQLNEYQEEPKHASPRLDSENNSDDTQDKSFKSVPEMQPFATETLPLDKGDITNDQQSQREEASMRSSETQNEQMQLNENKDLHEFLPMGLEIERIPEERSWQYSKSVPELTYDSMVSMPTEELVITDDQQAHKEETSMRSSESQNEELQLNEYQEEPKHASPRLDSENNSDDTQDKSFKSVPEMQPFATETLPLDKGDITNDQQSQREEASMRSSETQNEQMQLNENKDLHEFLPMGLEIERIPEERSWQYSKSVPELTYDSMVSMPTEELVITDDQQAHKEETSMRSSESQNEELQLNKYQEEPKYASARLNIENNSDDTPDKSFKSVPELQPHPPESMPSDNEAITNDQQLQREEESMRSSDSQRGKMHLNENQEGLMPTGLDNEHHPEERTWQYSKSVPELSYDSMPRGEVVSFNNQQVQNEEAGMRSSESQNEKLHLNEYQEEPKYASTILDIENNSDDTPDKSFKSVPEMQPFPTETLPLDKGDVTNDQHSQREEASMRSSQSQNENMQSSENKELHKLLSMGLDIERHPEDRTWQFSKSVPEPSDGPMLSMPTEKIVSSGDHYVNKEETRMRSSVSQNENQNAQEPLMIRLDMTNHPEDLKWPFSKSVPELPFDPMVSMPSDNVGTTNEHRFLKEGNMRLSQNQNGRTQFDDYHGLLEFSPTKQGDARLTQTENERQHFYFNHHLYEPQSSRLDTKQKFGDDSLAALRFNYIQHPIKEQTAMRLSQNQNDNKEIQYPSTSLGLSDDMNSFMSVAQPQHLHENRNPILRSSNERPYLSHNFKTLPEYKMLPRTSQFEFNNGQNAYNEHFNMRMNQEQSRDPEPIENHYIRQDNSPNTFKSNVDFDHTLHRSNEFGNEKFIPHEAPKTVNTLEYRTRPQLFSDPILDDTQSSRWFQTQQHNDHFSNYYKTIPEVQEQYSNPHFLEHLRRVAVNHRVNDADTFTSHDYPSSRARLHDHMQKYHQEKSSNIDSSMEQGMHMSMREPFVKSDTEYNNMHFNHPHGTARFGAALPVAGVSPGAVGVYPTGNGGGCGIPLLLSCSPSVVSGSLARPNIVGPIFKSVDDNFKYYIKRDAKNIEDVPDIKVQKASLPHSLGTGATDI